VNIDGGDGTDNGGSLIGRRVSGGISENYGFGTTSNDKSDYRDWEFGSNTQAPRWSLNLTATAHSAPQSLAARGVSSR